MSDPAPRLNPLGQPIGAALPEWTGASAPDWTPMQGRFCRLEPLEPGHADALQRAFALDRSGAMWTYMPCGPFADAGALRNWLDSVTRRPDPMFFAILDAQTGDPVGFASFLRIDPANGVIEVGWIAFSPLLQRRPAATEAMHLMMARVFDDWGYRRYEWKCDTLNAGSRRAAERLGFRYDGLFRQAVIYKQRNRDTAWFSVLDGDWPAIRAAQRAWLAPDNFDADGQQRQNLGEMMSETRKSAPARD
jgi:RimJ/RimL family protein N-acetyltransferase